MEKEATATRVAVLSKKAMMKTKMMALMAMTRMMMVMGAKKAVKLTHDLSSEWKRERWW